MDFKLLYEDKSGSSFVAITNYTSRIIFGLLLLFFAPGIWGTIIAISYVIFLHPIIWNVADKFRSYTQPDVFLSTGAIDTFSKRIFWKIGPQLISTFLLTILILISFFFLWSSKSVDEISKTPPMPLPIEKETGYFVFDVTKEKGFLTKPLLSAATINPIVLTGGVPIVLSTLGEPVFEDTADKNTKKLRFPVENKHVYVPEICIEKLTIANGEIWGKTQELPGRDCSTAGCTYLVDPKQIVAKQFTNNACPEMAPLPVSGLNADVPDCKVNLYGKEVSILRAGACSPRDYVFSFSPDHGGGLNKNTDLEKIRDSKIKKVSE